MTAQLSDADLIGLIAVSAPGCLVFLLGLTIAARSAVAAAWARLTGHARRP